MAIGAVLLLTPGAVHAQAMDGDTMASDEIVVTATRTEKPLIDVPAAITVVDNDDLRRRGLTVGSDEFRGIPGIFFRRTDGDSEDALQFSFRGVTGSAGGDTFLALIDGIPFVGPDEQVLLNQVPYGAISRTEIVRGPVSALYGRGATAGAVNYITRRPGVDGTTASLTAGSYDYFRGEATLERKTFGDRGGILLSGFYEDDDGWRQHSHRQILNLFGKIVVPVGSSTTVTAYGNYFDRQVEVPSNIPLLDDGSRVSAAGGRRGYIGYDPSDLNTKGGIGAIRLTHRFGSDVELVLTGQHRRFDRNNSFNLFLGGSVDPQTKRYAVNGFARQDQSNIWIGDAQITARLGAHTIVAGGNVERARMDERDFWSGEYGFTPQCGFRFFQIDIDYATGDVLNANAPCFQRNFLLTDGTVHNRFWGAYLQDEWAATDRLTVTLGLRYDDFRRRAEFRPIEAAFNPGGRLSVSEHAFSPKATVAYRLGERGAARGILYASYGRGFSSNFGPLFYFDPLLYQLDLKPMTIDSYEVGYKGEARSGLFTWEAALFRYDQRNRLVNTTNPDPNGPSTLLTTGQRYRSQGVELSGTVHPAPNTTISANYSYVDAIWREYRVPGAIGEVDLTGKRPVGVPSHIFNFSAQQRFASWLNGRADLYVYGNYPVTGDNRVEKGGYDLFNLSATIVLPTRLPLALDLAVTNVLDRKIFSYFGTDSQPTYATPSTPRLFRATVRVSF
ncbi:TonB-dependent receptor [uncultured Sphingomonas sp.]|uniref:TonB-dependent receptor n=1 Tax=uncultured Sphingomonas sp. TaxID=158754 RepID=UPI0025E2734F|nr:TonB-dependent receptor [uncultured Sphingomonas sp.]